MLRRTAWFKFSGAAGSALPVRPPGGRRCGTDWTGWLATPHPPAGSTMNGSVCFSSRSDACQTTVDVQVCAFQESGEFVYRLPAPRGCLQGYCGDRTPSLQHARCERWCNQSAQYWRAKCEWPACGSCEGCSYSALSVERVAVAAAATARRERRRTPSSPPNPISAAMMGLVPSAPWDVNALANGIGARLGGPSATRSHVFVFNPSLLGGGEVAIRAAPVSAGCGSRNDPTGLALASGAFDALHFTVWLSPHGKIKGVVNRSEDVPQLESSLCDM